MNEQNKNVYGKKAEGDYQGIKREGSYRLSSTKGSRLIPARTLATTLRNLLCGKTIWMKPVILWCTAHDKRQRQRQRSRSNA